MKKQLSSTTVYEPNKNVKIKVVNKPIVDELTGEMFGFGVTVTVSIKKGIVEKELKFSNDDDIAEFMGQVEYDDPQQSLALGGK